MEKQSKILILLLVALTICIGVFLYQYNNDVGTIIMINQTEVSQNSSFSGMLIDSFGQGVANQTITYQKPGQDNGDVVDVTTDDKGEFKVENAEYLSNNSDDNYYSKFTFVGDEKYKGFTYEGKVIVKPI